jgi:hypothetical protein
MGEVWIVVGREKRIIRIISVLGLAFSLQIGFVVVCGCWGIGTLTILLSFGR